MSEEEAKATVGADLEDDDDELQIIDFSKTKKKKKVKGKKVKKIKTDAAAAERQLGSESKQLAFDLNRVEGHEEFEYSWLLDRIEKIALEKNMDNEDDSKKQRGELPVTRFISSTKTSWQNFQTVAEGIGRDPQHILDFFKAELDCEGNFGSEGNMIF